MPERPIGFAPGEVSRLVNREVLSQHADEAGFLWTLRAAAITEPHFGLKDLAALDERVAAHLDGLWNALDLAWEMCAGPASDGDAGALFAASWLAFESGSRQRMTDALRAAVTASPTLSPMISALGWIEFDRISPWVRRLLDARSPAHRAIGVAASAVHRRDPGGALAALLAADAVQLRARALRATGELKRSDLRGALRDHLTDGDEECRYWAAWSATLLGNREGLSSLIAVAESSPVRRDVALQLALRAVRPAEAADRVRALARDSGLARTALVSAGVLGDPAFVPWLISRMEDPALGRIAGEAFEMITGADIALDDLELDEAPGEAEDALDAPLELADETNLPMPSVRSVQAWWDAHQDSFRPGQRYLLGRPVSRDAAREVLRSGRQRQRAAAALELALLEPDEPLFEVRAPGWRQQRQLTTWTS